MNKTLLQEVKVMNRIAGTQLTKEQEINLIKNRLNELEFSHQASFDTYKKTHKMRPDTKVKNEDYNPTKMYVVVRPSDNLDASGMIMELNPLEGIQPLNIEMSNVLTATHDESEAQRIAAEAYGKYCNEVQALEEKKGKVGNKIKSTIDHLEKKRKEHIDMVKEDPKSAAKHKEQIAKLATQIDDLVDKMEKIEKSKKNVEKKEDKKEK